MESQDKYSGTAGLNGAPGGKSVSTLGKNPARFSRDYVPPKASSQVSRRWPATPRSSRRVSRSDGANSLPEAHETPNQRGLPHRIRRHWTWTQRLGGLLIALICAVSAVWYAPRVIRGDRRLLTGTVTSSGVLTLNFTDSGQIKEINVRLGQTVRKGQVLATEYAPNADSVVTADKAAIAYDRARIAQVRAAEPAQLAAAAARNSQISATRAQLALDEARLAADRLKVASTEIIAPSFGTIVAANGQPGETATSSGVRDYAAGYEQPLPARRPEFSLFPEGPQSVPRASASAYSLPVIALRTSAAWQVVALIPQDSVSGVAAGTKVTISVPAAHLTNVPGAIDAVLPNPVPTSGGTAYQARLTITGHTRTLPLNGMAADIHLGS